jgi:hypothetical protein
VRTQSLDPALVARLRALNSLDAAFYDASVAVFDAALAAARGAPGSVERGAWDADAAEFAAMQRALTRSFNTAATSALTGSAACVELKAWYSLSDVDYEARPPRGRMPCLHAACG